MRLDRGLTIDDFAEQSGVAREYVVMVERDLVSPTVDTLSRMLDTLNVTMTDFFREHSSEQVVFTKDEMEFDGPIADIIPDFGALSPYFLRIAPYEETPPYYLVDIMMYVITGAVNVKIQGESVSAYKTDVIHVKPSVKYTLVGHGRIGAELLCVPLRRTD